MEPTFGIVATDDVAGGGGDGCLRLTDEAQRASAWVRYRKAAARRSSSAVLAVRRDESSLRSLSPLRVKAARISLSVGGGAVGTAATVTPAASWGDTGDRVRSA